MGCVARVDDAGGDKGEATQAPQPPAVVVAHGSLSVQSRPGQYFNFKVSTRALTPGVWGTQWWVGWGSRVHKGVLNGRMGCVVRVADGWWAVRDQLLGD